MDNGHRVRQIEWTSWRDAPLPPIPIGADRNVHRRIFKSSRKEVKLHSDLILGSVDALLRQAHAQSARLL